MWAQATILKIIIAFKASLRFYFSSFYLVPARLPDNAWKDFLETPLRDGSKSTLSWQFLWKSG